MEDNALAMLHRVAGAQIIPPRRAGSLNGPLLKTLAPEPDDRPTMPEIRDELAKLAAGRDGDTTTVLLARTDLGGQRNRTAAFPPSPTPTLTSTPEPTPEPSPEPAPEPEPAPVVAPAARKAEPDAPPPRTPGRRRGRALWILAALVAAVLTGLIIFWAAVLDDDNGGGAEAQDPTQTSESSEAPADDAPAAEPNPGGGPADQPADEPAGEGDPLSADNIEQFLEDYHELVITDPRAAYARTGPTLRSNISEEDYVAFWEPMSEVRLSDIEAVDGQNTATATMELRFDDDRPEETSRRIFTFIVEDGRLILDSDFPQE
jgi:hypothetical protein